MGTPARLLPTMTGVERVDKVDHAALAGCQGRRPGAGARRRVMSPIMAYSLGFTLPED